MGLPAGDCSDFWALLGLSWAYFSVWESLEEPVGQEAQERLQPKSSKWTELTITVIRSLLRPLLLTGLLVQTIAAI